MIEIKEKKAQELLGINGKWASFDDFWDNYNNYKLDAPLKKAYKNGGTKLQKQLRDADEKFNIIRMLYGGEMLKMFPYAGKQGHMQWFAPGLTMLIYSAPLHADIKWLRKAQHMHIYMLLAFLSVLMTYFGVNYFSAACTRMLNEVSPYASRQCPQQNRGLGVESGDITAPQACA